MGWKLPEVSSVCRLDWIGARALQSFTPLRNPTKPRTEAALGARERVGGKIRESQNHDVAKCRSQTEE